jgi:hypothetical protein
MGWKGSRGGLPEGYPLICSVISQTSLSEIIPLFPDFLEKDLPDMKFEVDPISWTGGRQN